MSVVATVPFSIPFNTTGPVFAVDSCSGQLTVFNAVLDYETTRQYVVNVSTYILGPNPNPIYAAVTVTVLNVNEPPLIPAGQVRTALSCVLLLK